VEGRGLKPDKCSRSKCVSLDSIAASRAFSFLSCSVSLSICFVLSLLCSISLSSCFIRSSYSISRCSTPGSRRQLSVCNHKRHRGSDAPDTPLLGELDGGACGEVDVVIGREQGDQGNREAGDHLDPALKIETAAATRQSLDFRQVWRRFESGIGFGSGIGLRQGPAASIKQHSTPVRMGVSVLAAVRWGPTTYRWARNAENTSIRMAPQAPLPGSQLGSYEGQDSPVEGRGLMPDKCSRLKRASDGPISGGRVVGGGARSQNGSNRLR